MDLYAASSSDGSAGIGVFLILVVIVLYFLPTVVAVKRDIPNKGTVIVLNIFLGWTFFGWIVALALSFGSKGQQIVINNGYMPPQQPGGWNAGPQPRYGPTGPQHYGQQPAIGGASGPQAYGRYGQQQHGQQYGQQTGGHSTGEHTTPPSGWYPDPSGAAGAERFYDGSPGRTRPGPPPADRHHRQPAQSGLLQLRLMTVGSDHAATAA